MENSKPAPIILGKDEGQGLSVMGGTYKILISGKQTNGALAVIDMLIPPNGGPGPHAHAEFIESFYVIGGEVEVSSEAGKYTAAAGAFVAIPKGGIVHGFKNKSDAVAHLLCIVAPAGLEEMFEETGTPVALGEFLPPPQMTDPEVAGKIMAIAEKYGQKLYPPDYLDKQ